MRKKLYKCRYTGGCEVEQPILSKGLCNYHRDKQRREAGEETFTSKKHPIRKFKKSSRDNRKKERECLDVYFGTLINKLSKKPFCENCNHKINFNYLPYNNVAHILPKGIYKSVMCNLDNHLILCDSKDRIDGGSCHRDFDNKTFEFVKNMPVFNKALKKFSKIKPFVLENKNLFSNFDKELEKL